MNIRKIHHVAYRCKDAKQTVEWYGRHLGMKFVLAIAEDQVPSTHAPDPYMHVFMDAGGGNVLAFFELPNSPPQGRDEATAQRLLDDALERMRQHGTGEVPLSPEESLALRKEINRLSELVHGPGPSMSAAYSAGERAVLAQRQQPGGVFAVHARASSPNQRVCRHSRSPARARWWGGAGRPSSSSATPRPRSSASR